MGATGNTAALLNDIVGKNSAAINTASDLIGTAADFSGAIGGILSVIGLLLNRGNQTQAELQDILNTIQSDFQQLGAQIKAGDIVQRLTNLVNDLSDAESASQNLTAEAESQPPLTDAERIVQIEKCTTALNALSPPVLWALPFNDQIFWTDQGEYLVTVHSVTVDVGYGQQAPSADSNGLVFSYLYVLPAYLYALSLFLTVAGALDSNLISDYGDSVIRPAADLLKARHDEIVGQPGAEPPVDGITLLSPGAWDGTTLALWVRATGEEGAGLEPGVVPTTDPQGYAWGVQIEYGAVDMFGGDSSMATYTISLQGLPGSPPPGLNSVSTSSTDPTPYHKFQIRLLKRAKDVYQGVGLLNVWGTINQLSGLVGDAPLPRPTFADWSFRRDIVGPANVSTPTGTSLLAIASFIKNTPPADTPSKTLWTSFRDLLEV